MSIELLQMISVGAMVLAGIWLIVAVILFVLFDIRTMIGDLSGANERRAIAEIKRQNENTESLGTEKLISGQIPEIAEETVKL